MKTIQTNDLFNSNMLTVFVVDNKKLPKMGESFIFGGSNGDNEIYVVIRYQKSRIQEFIDTESDSSKGRTGINPNIPVDFPAGKIGIVARKSGKRVGIVQS